GIVRPWSAMTYCYEIWSGSGPIERRRLAVWVLKWIGDERAFGWVRDFLDDPDESIQVWGAGLLDQLLWCGHVAAEDCEGLLVRIEAHRLQEIRDTAKFIRKYLADRGEWAKIFEASNARWYAERS